MPLVACLAILPAAASEGRAREARLEALGQFRIRGLCSGTRLADAVARGANAVRTYSTPSRAELDRLQAAGVRVIPGVWLPHEAANQAREGGTWHHSYPARGEQMLAEFASALDRVGDHPAILMWTLGNEVRLEPHYLRHVERMSRLVHERFPRIATSLTIVNAPADSLRLIGEHAPDIDVIGVNAYGQGAIGTAIESLENHWDGGFYFSEFNATGPWWGPQASWGPRFEPSGRQKAEEIAKAWERITAARRCVGGCLFQWGRWEAERITYFSALLPADPFAERPAEPDLRFTPVADAIAGQWAGRLPARLAPVLERVEIDGIGQRDIVVAPGMALRCTAEATDADTPVPALRYRWWIAREEGGRLHALTGPVETTEPEAVLSAPIDRDVGLFLVAAVLDDGDGICAMTLPFRTAR